MKNVLFLCTANSARSILAEAILNHLGAPHFAGYSAGSTPRGIPNPVALQTLRDMGHDTDGYASKSWDVFATPDAPKMDYIFTLCDSAAAEACPLWPGHPASAHWGLPDPAGQTDEPAAFRAAYAHIARRMQAFVALAAPTPDDFKHIGTLP